MKIYGIAILSLCYLAGQVIGDLLGLGFAFEGNIGGVAFGMLFLIVFADYFKNKGVEPVIDEPVINEDEDDLEF